MKRARDSADDTNTEAADGLLPNKCAKPLIINPPAAAEDDDPYGFGKVGAPGFMSKPTGMKAGGFVPGYLRIPGASGGMAPGATTMKSARTALTGPGAQPRSTPTFSKAPSAAQPQASAAATASQSQPTAAVTAVSSAQAAFETAAADPAVSDAAQPEDTQQQGFLDERKRARSKELDDPNALLSSEHDDSKPSASASGPISTQAQPLPGFHAEIESFVEKAMPTQAEQLTKAAAFERVKAGCLASFSRSQYAMVNVQPFGSYANGLSLAGSDIDVVVTGVAYPDDGRGGYEKESRKPVTDQLFRVVKQLRAQHAVARGGSALQIISGARIPIIKLTTVEGSEVDISLGSDDGVKAAEVIKGKLQEYPLAQPLTIVIKAFLKARRLTDVSTGGLGGYALINMVIAHLQEEAKGGSPVTDLGQLLMGFFRRYGSYFNLYTDAVAIGSGGICPKKSVCQSLQDILAPRLCVQDISTLRDVASGSKRITEVYEAFHSSAETLEQQAKTYQDEAPADGWLALLFEITPFTMREAVELEEELPQQSGRPNVLPQARPHIMMAKSQPKQHGEPGFMMRKTQPNHRSSGGHPPGKSPHSNSRTVVASPPPKQGTITPAATSVSPPGSATKTLFPTQARPAYSPPVMTANGGPIPGLQSPPAAYSKAPTAISTPPYAATSPYSIPAAAPVTYSMGGPHYAAPAAHPAPATGLPPNLSSWHTHATPHAYSMAAYQYQMAQQMQISAQMTSYMMAQSMPMAYPTVGQPPPGPRPPPGSPPPKF